MQVFIVGSPLETAEALDAKRLNKQIIECQQILDALNGKHAWRNHPCTLQYRGHEKWLERYIRCLTLYRRQAILYAGVCSYLAKMCTPPFHTQEYFSQMKRRLYTKNKEHYKQWAHLGESQENWYFVNDEWCKYINGKRID